MQKFIKMFRQHDTAATRQFQVQTLFCNASTCIPDEFEGLWTDHIAADAANFPSDTQGRKIIAVEDLHGQSVNAAYSANICPGQSRQHFAHKIGMGIAS